MESVESTVYTALIIVGIIGLALAILMLAAMWKIYTKAGQPGWACIIPIYSTIVLLRIVGKPLWWLGMFFLPLLSFLFIFNRPLFSVVYFLTIIPTFVYSIWMVNMLSKSFGKDEGFTVGLILLGFIFIPILGFGSAQYQGPYGNPEAFEAYKNAGKFDFEQNKLQA